MTRIDVHCHYLPDFYREALIAGGHHHPDGVPFIPEWSEQAALAVIDDLGIDTAYLSISSPGVHFGDDDAARLLARRVNEEGARMQRAHPGRFGFFASTPLPDIDGALAEIDYAFDELGAAGVVFETNFDGVYLGSEQLAPIYAELDRRNAVLFLHPTSPAAPCTGAAAALPYPRPLIEFLFDTTRSVIDMALSGTLDRYPNIQVIVPHSGAALPMLASRVDLFGGKKTGKPELMHRALRRLHFDLAGMPLPDQLPALLKVADPAHIHYGSDFPFTLVSEIATNLDGLDSMSLLDGTTLSEAAYRNSTKLLRAHRTLRAI